MCLKSQLYQPSYLNVTYSVALALCKPFPDTNEQASIFSSCCSAVPHTLVPQPLHLFQLLLTCFWWDESTSHLLTHKTLFCQCYPSSFRPHASTEYFLEAADHTIKLNSNVSKSLNIINCIADQEHGRIQGGLQTQTPQLKINPLLL